MGPRKINDLGASPFLFSVICDSILMFPGSTTTHENQIYKAATINHIERFNNTLQQRVPRLVREAWSFSKQLAHHIGAIKLFICHYNLTRTAA